MNEIINTIENKITNQDFKLQVKETIKNMFINLNIIDINFLTILSTFIGEKIYKLFDFDYKIQYSKNNSQDLKSVILLILPYIDNQKNNAYNKIQDLNELILSAELKESDLEIEQSELLNTHFKYTNIGIGLFNKDKQINLIDPMFNKLIYKVIYYKFYALLETLFIINGKLYVNWLNVVPLSLNNYQSSNIYQKTMRTIDYYIDEYLNNNIMKLLDYNGLYIGEFYNVYRNVYYINIKKVKWFIYVNNKQYIVQYLSKTFNFDNFFIYNCFNDLDSSEKRLFENKLRIINNDLIYWKNIIIYFVNNYTYCNLLSDEILEKFRLNVDDSVDYDFIVKNNHNNSITDQDILNFLKEVEPGSLWDYIKESLIIFQSTIYSFYLIKDNKIQQDYLYYENTQLTLKNIYNIAKSISHISSDNWELLPSKYSSLNIYTRLIFWNKFKGNNVTKWLNLQSNINIEEGRILSSAEYTIKINQKVADFNTIKYELVWKYLVSNGILSDFKNNFHLTDSRHTPKDKIPSKLKDEFSKNPEYLESYYYLTNKKYNYQNDFNKETTFVKELIKTNWYTFYALDWVCQIDFFNHYLNHRVLYITGATGQGKSTQVPKLFMYGLKMLDYKANGKVICTQPRIGPTNGNSDRISNELYTPIQQYSNTFKDKVKTDNFYVQYKHSNNSHIKKFCDHLTLKIVTDGTLLSEVTTNPLLKYEIKELKDREYKKVISGLEKEMKEDFNLKRKNQLEKDKLKLERKMIGNNNIFDIFDDYNNIINGYRLSNLTILLENHKNINTNYEKLLKMYRSEFTDFKNNSAASKYYTKYIDTNLYDILIIDEAHEHNTNMDLILTLCRQSCYYNNDIKLVIMSATMDDDEPIFRRYYNIINDNLVYPIKSPQYNYFTNKRFLYDSLFLDRRFHIAPPGQSTQHNITEIYEPDGDINTIVQNICTTTAFGDILVFENGLADINKRLDQLNKIIPTNTIAIPYYAALNDKYKNLIEIKLEENVEKIRTAKDKVSTIWTTEYHESDDVPMGTYKRCVIVATNVAEASITIKNLRYVIDNGYSKVNTYNSYLDVSTLTEDEISESSRKQRKGRVGRTAAGTVYYLYKKGAREKIKPKYKITQENFTYSMVNLLETRSLVIENEDILDNSYDPNIYNRFKHYYVNTGLIKFNKMNRKNISKIIEKYYVIDNNRIYDFYWDNSYFDHMSTNKLNYMKRTESGYNLLTLLDLEGKFYLIHPFENILKRNILGDILSYDGIKYKKNLPHYLYNDILFALNMKYMVVNMQEIFSLQETIEPGDFYKTEYSNYIYELMNYINWKEKTYEDVMTLLTSKAYGSFDSILEIITLIKTINGTIDNLTITKKNQENEIEYLYNLITNFKKSFSFINIFKIEKVQGDLSKTINEFVKDYIKNKLNPPVNKYKLKTWDTLVTAYTNGKLYNENCMLYYESNKNNDKYLLFKKDIINWCNINNVKSTIWLNFIETHYYVLYEFATIKEDFDDKLEELDPLEKIEIESSSFKKSLIGNNEYEKIIRPFIHGNGINIGLRINSHDFNHKTIPPVNIIHSNKKNIKFNLFFYHIKKKIDFNNIDLEVSIINRLDIEWLFNALPFYYKPKNFKNVTVYRNPEKGVMTKHLNGDIYNDFIVELKNKYNPNNLPFESTKLPILHKYINGLKKLK